MANVDTVRSGVALADRLTRDLQVAVAHSAWIGQDMAGKPTYATAVSRLAIVEKRQRLVRSRDGQEIMTCATITFMRPIAANGAADRQEPIDPRDRFVLLDGTTGPVVDVQGLADAGSATGASFFYQVTLGLQGLRST